MLGGSPPPLAAGGGLADPGGLGDRLPPGAVGAQLLHRQRVEHLQVLAYGQQGFEAADQVRVVAVFGIEQAAGGVVDGFEGFHAPRAGLYGLGGRAAPALAGAGAVLRGGAAAAAVGEGFVAAGAGAANG
ncbi:hypothetical protein [Streptomyces sp. NPDC018045]|uniref:hypothetical protein n=1 Tax=Streptomyces sp. NPDC018045 TaxID=3365037 RepID=UPI0037B0193D